MSSVGSADKRNAQDEALRRTRETYEERETDDAKKHSNEVKRLTEAHRSEVTSMQQSHNAQMEELKSKTADALSQRDMRFQKEISDLREMNQANLRKQAADHGNRAQSTESTLRGEIDRVERTNAEQKKNILSQSQQQMREKDMNFEEYANKSRETLQKTTVQQREKLNAVHGKEMKAAVDDRNRQQIASQSDFDRMRTVKETQIKDLERTRKNDISRLTAGNEAVRKDQDANYRTAIDQAREASADGLKSNRDRYQKALEKNTASTGEAGENFKNSISERINDRVNTGEAENHRLKSEITRQQAAMNRQKNREVRNTRDAMQDNIEVLEKDRKAIVGATNAKTAEEISKLTKRNDETINRGNRLFQEKIVTDRAVADERLNQTKNELEGANKHLELRSESRIAKLSSQNERDESKLRNFFDQSSTAQKANFETTLNEMRNKNRIDQETIIQSFTQASGEREAKFQAKMTEINSRYEKSMQENKDLGERALREQGAIAQREKKQLVEQKNLEIQRQAGQFENRIAKLEETHKREVDTINRRHEESMLNLTRATKKS